MTTLDKTVSILTDLVEYPSVSSESNFVLRSRILECQDLGASSFLNCPPRMNKPNETILIDYFRTAQESSKIPIGNFMHHIH